VVAGKVLPTLAASRIGVVDAVDFDVEGSSDLSVVEVAAERVRGGQRG
jgi:hypothetical protein